MMARDLLVLPWVAPVRMNVVYIYLFIQDVKTGICISQEFKIKYRRQGLYFISRIIFLLIVKKKIERGNNSKFIIKHYFQWTSYKKKKRTLKFEQLILTYSKISTVDKALAPLRPFSQDTVPGAEDFTFLFCLSNNEKKNPPYFTLNNRI